MLIDTEEVKERLLEKTEKNPNPMESNPIEVSFDSSTKKANIVLDMSSWDLFEVCKFRYHLRYNLNRQPKEKSRPLDMGGTLHEGLEVYYKALANGIHFNDRMQAGLDRIRYYVSNPELSSVSHDEEYPIIVKAFEENLTFWRFEDEQLEFLDIERPFAYVMYEDEYVRIIITGKIDLLVNYNSTRFNYKGIPIDHKSFSRDSEVLRLTNQFQNYCHATNSNYLIVNRIGLQKTLKPEEKYKRIPLSYDPLILEDWKNNLVDGLIKEYLPCVAEQKWRMNFTSCLKYNKRCEYYDICDTSGESNKGWKLENGFHLTTPWDVTATFNKKK